MNPAMQGLVGGWPGEIRVRSWQQEHGALPGAPVRARILALVQADPGIHKSDLCRMAGLSWGSVSHHLNAMVRQGMVRLHTVGKKTLVFPPEIDEGEWSALCAMRDARAVAVVDALRSHRRARLGELQASVGIDAKTLRRLLQRLESAAIVQKHGYARPQFSLRGPDPPMAMSASSDSAPGVAQ